jgi:hypothetical protein
VQQMNHSIKSSDVRRGHLLSFAFVMILLSTSLGCAVASASSVDYSGTSQEFQASAHSYSNSLDAAYDGSNSSYALLVVRGCDGESCTSSSFLDAEYLLSSTSTPTILEFEWNIQAYDSFTPSGATTDLSMYNYATTTWSVMSSVTGTLSGWELVNVTIPSAFVNQNNELKLRIGGFHNDEGSSSDELGIWVREFHLYSDDVTSNDADQDGVTDDLDACPNGDSGWTSNATTDNDSDGCQDSGEDLDDDDDGVADDVDVFPFNALEWADFDGDLIGDNADSDDDADGFDDNVDAFPLDALEWADYDNDSIGDNADSDDDADGFDDDVDDFPLNALEWADSDNDSIGDNADSDDDNDGYSDAEEEQIGTNPKDDSIFPPDFDGDYTADFFDDDDDNDGISDDDDRCNRDIGKNWGEREDDTTYSHNYALDIDFDGCRDSDEDDDDDNDKRDDNDDQCPEGDMNWNSSDPDQDSDEDGCRDNSQEDRDDDNDSWNDTTEEECGTDSRDAESVPIDSDGDRICDSLDSSPDQPEPLHSNDSSETGGKTSDCGKGTPDWYCNTVSGYEAGLSLAFMSFVIISGFWRRLATLVKKVEVVDDKVELIDDKVEEMEDQFEELEHPNSLFKQ